MRELSYLKKAADKQFENVSWLNDRFLIVDKNSRWVALKKIAETDVIEIELSSMHF